jgi:uncharacterized protein
MRLVLDSDPKIYTIHRYEDDAVVVGERTLRQPFIISAERLIDDWPATRPAMLGVEAIAALLDLKPEIILLGSHEPRSLPRTLVADLARRGIALETMTLGAACRTYNVLVYERRPVVAGLFPA